jgi:hypothetical protein
MIGNPPLSTLSDLAGTFKFVSSLDKNSTLDQQTVKWFLLGRSHFSQEQFVQRLSVLGIYDSILNNPESFHPVFCYSLQQINTDLISHVYGTKFTEVGSNQHCSESLVVSHWNDYLLDVEERAETEVTLNDILFFVVDVKLYHHLVNCLSFYIMLKKMVRFPKANTCMRLHSLFTCHPQLI